MAAPEAPPLLHRLLAEVAALRAAMAGSDVLMPPVSGWSVGEHLSHVALAAPFVFFDQVREPDASDRALGPLLADPGLVRHPHPALAG